MRRGCDGPSYCGLAFWLKAFDDPDADILVDGVDNFAIGVWVGVDKPLPRCPQVFPPKVKHRKLDDTDFNPVASNYPSAQLSSKQLEEKQGRDVSFYFTGDGKQVWC